MTTIDMNRLEIIEDFRTGEVVWSGSVDEFTAANVDTPMAEEEIEFLSDHGYVVLGGGAQALICVRYAGVVIEPGTCSQCGRPVPGTIEPPDECGPALLCQRCVETFQAHAAQERSAREYRESIDDGGRP